MVYTECGLLEQQLALNKPRNRLICINFKPWMIGKLNSLSKNDSIFSRNCFTFSERFFVKKKIFYNSIEIHALPVFSMLLGSYFVRLDRYLNVIFAYLIVIFLQNIFRCKLNIVIVLIQ